MLTPLNLPKGETFYIHHEILIHFAPPLALAERSRRKGSGRSEEELNNYDIILLLLLK